MIGQNKLIQQFNNFTLDTLPHAIILSGPQGSGRHTFCSLIANQFNLQLNQIDDKINHDLLDTLNNTVVPTLYIIAGNNISSKEENVLLKFIEEPLSHIFIIIICESKNQLLQTILTRCQNYTLEDYSAEILAQFIPADYTGDRNLLLQIANTPGKIINWVQYDLTEIYRYANLILSSIKTANISNIFNISSKFKPDDPVFNIFTECLLYCSYQNCINHSSNCISQYNITKQFYNNLKIPSINKQYLFEHYLFTLRAL